MARLHESDDSVQAAGNSHIPHEKGFHNNGTTPTDNTYVPDEKEYKHHSSDPDLVHDDEHNHPILADKLARKLSARQVQMIAIAGTIGTGLFLGTGRSLSRGGPAAMLICYSITGMVIFVTMLALGEMAAFMPIAGSFCTYAGRFVDDALGFALTWNYWFNDSVAVAADLVALQLLLNYWDTNMPGWGIALIFWVFLIAANIITVRAYGEVSVAYSKLFRLEILTVDSLNTGFHYSRLRPLSFSSFSASQSTVEPILMMHTLGANIGQLEMRHL